MRGRYAVDEGYVPTLNELATVLSRVPRWNGQTMVPWSVLQHSLVAGQLVRGRGGSPVEVLRALLHDIEEAVTGDIPRPHKTLQQADYGEAVRQGLLRDVFGLPGDFTEWMHDLDDEVAYAEAVAVGHPHWVRWFGEQDYPADDAVEAVVDLADADRREAVYLWEGQVRDLLEEKTVKAQQRRHG